MERGQSRRKEREMDRSVRNIKDSPDDRRADRLREQIDGSGTAGGDARACGGHQDRQRGADADTHNQGKRGCERDGTGNGEGL